LIRITLLKKLEVHLFYTYRKMEFTSMRMADVEGFVVAQLPRGQQFVTSNFVLEEGKVVRIYCKPFLNEVNPRVGGVQTLLGTLRAGKCDQINLELVVSHESPLVFWIDALPKNSPAVVNVNGHLEVTDPDEYHQGMLEQEAIEGNNNEYDDDDEEDDHEDGYDSDELIARMAEEEGLEEGDGDYQLGDEFMDRDDHQNLDSDDNSNDSSDNDNNNNENNDISEGDKKPLTSSSSKLKQKIDVNFFRKMIEGTGNDSGSSGDKSEVSHEEESIENFAGNPSLSKKQQKKAAAKARKAAKAAKRDRKKEKRNH
jgi:hypothetical protein